MANNQRIGVLDYARSNYDGNNVTIELFRRSKITPYGILFQKVPITENQNSFFLFYKTTEDGATPHFEEKYIAFPAKRYGNMVDGLKFWFGREWSHRGKLRGGEFSELWIGWLPEELQGLGKRTYSKKT